MSPETKLRVARPTDHLDAIATMYVRGLGCVELGRFEDHRGFDGVMLGHPEASYHLEFTSQRGHAAGPPPSAECLLVFYVPDAGEFGTRCEAMTSAGFRPVTATNPYWDERGRTFEDLDGWRVVLQNASWDR